MMLKQLIWTGDYYIKENRFGNENDVKMVEDLDGNGPSCKLVWYLLTFYTVASYNSDGTNLK